MNTSLPVQAIDAGVCVAAQMQPEAMAEVLDRTTLAYMVAKFSAAATMLAS